MSPPREHGQVPNQGISESVNSHMRPSLDVSNDAAAAINSDLQSPLAVEPSPAQPASSFSAHRVRRRNRMITSCLECRRRKLKCDKLHPCTNCAKSIRDCVFLAPALDSVSQLKLAEIKEKMGVLERGLEAEVTSATKPHQPHPRPVRKGSGLLPGELRWAENETDRAKVPEDERDLEPTPLAVADAAFDDDAGDDMLDLGIKMGKMRMTERLGGFFRPKMTEEIEFTLSMPKSASGSPDENRNPVPPISPEGLPHVQRHVSDREAFLAPGPTYIAPGSGFFFGSAGSQHSIVDFIPSRLAGDRLVRQYHDAVHVIARVVHWPSFQSQYEAFWAKVNMGLEPSASLQGIVFAVLFSAVVSMNDNDVTALFSISKKSLMVNFQTATEVALGRANFLRTTKLETLQALVIYLIPMCRNEMSRAHSVLVATAIRLAECMGLHRDPQETYGLGALESHVRRTLWYQLCILDMRSTEAQGPRPYIRRDDFDANFPLNANDADFVSGDAKECDGWTDMTFSKMRFECNEMHRVIWAERSRLEQRQVSLTHVLGKIESFRKAMEAKYHPILDENVPLQREAKIVMNLLLLRMHIMVLHRYHNSVRVRIPDRLRQIILTTGTQQMEDAVQLETDPALQPWSWYTGAYQQWHTAFLLLVEVYSFPARREADRIWRILDYVFETDPSLTREEKGRAILSSLRDRTGVYRDIRKIRAPLRLILGVHGAAQGKSPPDFQSAPTSQTPHRPSMNNTPFYTATAFRPSSNASPPTPYPQFAPLFPSSSTGGTPTLTQLTQTFADAPSPISPADPAQDQNWTFDAPASFFMGSKASSSKNRCQPHGNNNGLAREQVSLASPPASLESPGSPERRGVAMLLTQATTANAAGGAGGAAQQGWDGAAFGSGDVRYGVATSLVASERGGGGGVGGGFSPDSSASGGGDGGGGVRSEASPQITTMGISAPEADVVMVDIDWSEWDKIFPPDVNTGILNAATAAPISQHF